MPDNGGGIEHPINALYKAGESAFLGRRDQVLAALEGRSLEEACDHLGHPGDEVPGAGFARRLMAEFDPTERETIARIVATAPAGEFPFDCKLEDKDLAGLTRVYAREGTRDGKPVVIISKTRGGD